MNSDVDRIKAAAAGRWLGVLEYVGQITRELLDGRHHPCPKCGGTDRFRAFDDCDQTGGVICNQCHPDKNGDGLSTVRWARGWDFQTTIREVANFLNVPLEGKKRKSKADADPAEHLEFQPWNDFIVWLWCRHKTPITPAAVQANGGRLARYRDYSVIALPIFGPNWPNSKPVGWVIWNTTGHNLPVFHGKGKPVTWEKMKTTYGSESGIIGLDGFSRLDSAQSVWKTEGPGDMLALWAAIPPGDRSQVAVITNGGGAKEVPAWIVRRLEGKDVVVVGDSDNPGQAGAEKWATALGRKSTCRNVLLPYPIQETRGKDVRDFFLDGHGWQDLRNLAAAASPATPSGYTPQESEDDPHRLARLFAARFAHEDGLTLRFWRDAFWRWNGNHYVMLSNSQLRAEIVGCIKDEFDRLNLEAQEENREGEDKTVKKVSLNVASQVRQSLASITLLPDDLDQPAWLDGRQEDVTQIIPVENGILDLGELLGGNVDGAIESHTPLWFSPVCVPYKFDMEADCPHWHQFLRRNLEDDQDRITLLQQWFGYCLTTSTDHQKFLLISGEGKNGKSVIAAALAAMLGEANTSHVALELFGQRFALAQTIGKLANICGDVDQLDNVAEGFLKAFTAGDRITIDRKNREPVDVIPTAKLVICCNDKPRFRDRSGGLWRRVILLPMDVEISEGERVHGMDKAYWWRKSGDLPGVLNWAIAGLQSLLAEGRFAEPVRCREAMDEYRLEANPAREFLAENFELKEGCVVEADMVYNAYRKWCEANGYRPLADRTLGREVKRAFPGVTKKRLGSRGDRKYFYDGITKKEDSREEFFFQGSFF